MWTIVAVHLTDDSGLDQDFGDKEGEFPGLNTCTGSKNSYSTYSTRFSSFNPHNSEETEARRIEWRTRLRGLASAPSEVVHSLLSHSSVLPL